MNIVTLSLRRPLTVIVLVIAIILGGFLSIQRMTRDIFPSLGVPTIYVAQPYGGMDPAQMEGYFTFYYEYHFLYITGIEHVESKSIQGASIMKLQFHPGTDMSSAMAETVAYVNRARAFMPAGTPGPFITRFDAGSVPVGYLVFSSDNPERTVGQIQDAALNLVRPVFATLPGVSAPPPFGGSARTIVININPEQMRSYNLSPDSIVQAISEANLISPSGNMNLGDQYPIVSMNAVAKNIKDLESLTIKTSVTGAVLLRDLAKVQDASDIITSYALVNGKRTVYMPVTKRADASTLAVVDLVKKNIAKFQSVLPEDVKVSFEFDQTPVVLHSIHSLVQEGLIGAVLTGLMVLLFLRDWRSALIVVINIPISLLAACFALWLTGQNVNIMTLGGLALAVGILIDEATVTVENIHSYLAKGTPLSLSVLNATRETTLPRLLAMLCILAVFLPALFMTGPAKALFTPLALSVGFSMAASYILSSTLVPILSIWFMRGHEGEIQDASFYARLRARYGQLLKQSMRLRWVLLGSYLGVTALVIVSFGSQLGLEIFPHADTGQFAMRLRAPSGTQVQNTEIYAKQALDIIADEVGKENIALTIGLVGVHGSNYPINFIHLWNGGPEEGWLAIRLRDGATVRTEELKERLRKRFAVEMPQVLFSFEPSDIVNRVMSFGSNTPIEVAVSGPDLAVSRDYAEKIYQKLRQVRELRDIQFAQSLDYPTVDVNVDRERAGLMGVSMSDVTHSLVPATTSSRFTTANYWADSKSGVSYNLQVQIPQTESRSIEDLKNVPVTSKISGSVLLRNIASIAPGAAVGQYERYNMSRVVSVTANIYHSDLGHVSRAVEKAISDIGPLPAKTTVNIRGQIPTLRELLGGFRSGLLVAVLVIFLLLTANFQSAQLSLVAVSTIPAVLAGVTSMLWVTGTTVNIQSAIGAIMAVGVAMANAILLVTFAERSRLGGAASSAAAIEGATSRLRPILMTSFAMMAGMLPMAFGLGEGGEQIAPLGRAVIGGLFASTIAALFILPVIFSIVRQRSGRVSVSLDAEDPTSNHYISPVTFIPEGKAT